MYPTLLAEQLREIRHDVVSAHERDDVRAAADAAIFEAMQVECRAILTNNVRHFMPIATRAVASGLTHHGLILTSDRSLPRSKAGIATFLELLDELMRANPSDDALQNEIRWLSEA